MFPYRLFAFLFALLALAAFSAADTLTVGPAGSGAQFSQIQAAIAAAQDDDVILVQAGTYQEIVVDKPLRILGIGPGGVTITDQSLNSVIVRDIGVGEEVVLSGVETYPLRRGVLLEDCAGTVVLQDGLFGLPFLNGLTTLRVESCARVVLLDSRVFGGGSNEPGLGAASAVFALDSTLWVANSEITGGDSDDSFDDDSPGIHVVNSTLHVWRTSIRGADHGGQTCDECAFDGGPGIRAVGSIVNLFGGSTSQVVGGQGSWWFYDGEGGPGIELANHSQARIQADIPIQGGFDALGLVQTPAILVDATSSVAFDAKVFPTLQSSTPRVQVGSSFDLTLEGNPGGYQVLYLSLRTGPTWSHRGVDGFGLLDPAQPSKLVSEVLPGSGALTVTVHVPSTTALIGSTFFFQTAERFPDALALRHLTPANRFAIGNPALVTITP